MDSLKPKLILPKRFRKQGRGPLDEEMDQLEKWFSGVYPQWQLIIHYKWKDNEHRYILEMNHHGKNVGMPFSVPDAWFEDPEMEATLREEVLQRLQRKTMQEIG
jgi:hypothetical protein